jgi:hypothetical protein
MRSARWMFVAMAMLAFPGTLPAQEARATIAGTVTDTSGGVVPGATVTITNVAMGTSVTVTTNDEGFFNAPFLLPGEYQVAAELAGFKKLVREGITLNVADRVQLDLALEVGAPVEVVTVTAETPLLNTSNASLGQVVDARRIAELPIAHGEPYKLIGLAAGTAYTGAMRLDRPFEPTHVVGYQMAGTRSNRSDITIDGVPATSTANAGEVIASYVPPQDLVQEFKVQTATFDASFGNTEGGVTNLSLKSGTNTLRGTAYFVRTPRALFANEFFANASNTDLPEFRYNRWGGTVGGPVVRNGTFFMYGYEGIHEARPRNNGTPTVPTERMRNGDFSELLALGPQYQIYNPFTRRATGDGRFVSDPFPGNLIPQALISPQARAILGYIPLPRNPGNPDGTRNFLRPDLKEETEYATHTIRIDHVVSDKQRMYGRASWYDRNSNYNNYFDSIATGDWFRFISRAAAIDHVYTFNGTTVMNVRYGYDRFLRGTNSNPGNHGMDLTTLGFPSYLNDYTPASIRRFPRINFPGGTYQGTGVGGEDRPTETQSAIATLTKALGAHTLKGGAEFRRYRETDVFFGNNQTAEFTFDSAWTRGPFNTSPAAPGQIGQSFASFLLGLPTSGLIARPASYDERSTTWGFFLQDDWRVGDRLTLNLGLRYEFETPLTEADNRSVRGFDLDAVQPLDAAVRAAYAANPIPEVPVSAFALRGGLTFPGVDGEPEGLYETPKGNVMPRVGAAYTLDDKTVVRGGYGMFYGFLGQRRGDVLQSGYSANTLLVPSLDNGLTFIETLANPFGRGIVEPQGAAQGIQTFLGQSISFFDPNPRSPRTQRWQVGIQRELPGKWLAEATYVGAYGSNLQTSRNLNAIPMQYLSGTGRRNQAHLDYMTQQVRNPFAGLMPSTAGADFRGATIARFRLLRPYPHFDNIVTTTNEGESWYRSLQLGLQRRFSAGYTLGVNYTLAKFEEATEFLNCTNANSSACFDEPDPARQISSQDVPHRLSVSGIWELPFGRGGTTLASRILGGWQVAGVYAYQTGFPIGNFGNLIYTGSFDDLALSNPTVERWFDTDAGFNRVAAQQPTTYDLRTFPMRVTELRRDAINNVDLSVIKNTTIVSGKVLQLRLEALNAFNHPYFGTPNLTPTVSAFGQVSVQDNYARRVQAMVKFIF